MLPENAAKSKHVLQCELHDPRRSGCANLAELAARRAHIRIHRPEAVRNVERFGAKLERLFFPELERSGQAHVNPDASRTEQVVDP